MSDRQPHTNIRESGQNGREAMERHEVIDLINNWVKPHLKAWFGVDNLSHIEEYRLRKIIEQCIRERQRDEAEAKKIADEIAANSQAGVDAKKSHDRLRTIKLSMFEPWEEAIFRWFWELYGIQRQDMPRVNIIRDRNTEEILYQESSGHYDKESDRRPLLAQLADLNKTEDGVDINIRQIPEDFKEYVRRLREKSHLT